MPPHQILYSEKYYDDEYEYRWASCEGLLWRVDPVQACWVLATE